MYLVYKLQKPTISTQDKDLNRYNEVAIKIRTYIKIHEIWLMYRL